MSKKDKVTNIPLCWHSTGDNTGHIENMLVISLLIQVQSCHSSNTCPTHQKWRNVNCRKGRRYYKLQCTVSTQLIKNIKIWELQIKNMRKIVCKENCWLFVILMHTSKRIMIRWRKKHKRSLIYVVKRHMTIFDKIVK